MYTPSTKTPGNGSLFCTSNRVLRQPSDAMGLKSNGVFVIISDINLALLWSSFYPQTRRNLC